jgi:hypothetical protein
LYESLEHRDPTNSVYYENEEHFYKSKILPYNMYILIL